MISKQNSTKKVLIYGRAPKSIFRSHELIRFLLTESEATNSWINPDFFSPSANLQESFAKDSNLFRKISKLFSAIELLCKAFFADYIMLLPANNNLINFAVWTSKVSGAKLIVDSYISSYDSLVRDRKLAEESSKSAKTAKKKDILALTQSDYFIHTGWCEIDYWERILGIKVEKGKIFIAPLFVPEQKNKSERAFSEDKVLRICWWGTFIPLHGLDNILSSLQILSSKDQKFECNLFGVNNEFYGVYQNKITEMGLENCTYLREDLRFSDGSLPEYLVNNCDLALGIFGETEKAYHVVPNKLIEALTLGIPTLTMDTPGLREFFKIDIDLWASSSEPEDIALKIMNIANGKAPSVDWELTREKVMETFNFTRYQEIIDEILNESG